MRITLDLYFRLISIQIRSQMTYQVSFWMETISTGVLNATYFLTFALVIERFGSISGWKLGEVAFLAGMVEMTFATMDLLFSGFDPELFSQRVRLGTFDQMLLRPYPITWQVMGSSFALRRLGRILEGLAVFLFGLSIIHVNWTFAKLMYLPVVFSSQVIAFGSLFIAGSTLIFWTVQPIEALNIVTYGGNELMSYPMHIYSGWIQRFFTYVIPFIFMNYYPALYFLDKPDPLKMPVIAPFLAPAAAVWMLAAALAFWRFGIRQYQGTGS